MIQIEKPKWHLAAACPECEQGSSLALRVCPQCSHLLVVCEEEGAVFTDPRRLTPLQSVDESTAACPSCDTTAVRDFQSADSTQIQAAALKPGEYV